MLYVHLVRPALRHSDHQGQMLYVRLVRPTAWRTVMSSMEENGIAPFEDRSEAAWDCLLQMFAFSFVFVLRNPLSLSKAILNASFLSDLTIWCVTSPSA